MARRLESYAAGRWFTAEDEGRPLLDASTGEEVVPHLRPGARPRRDDDVRADRRRPRAAGAHLPRAGRDAQGARQAPDGARRGVPRALAAHRSHEGRRDGRHRGRHRHPVRLRQRRHPAAAQRHGPPRRRPDPAGQGRHLRGPARLHLAARRHGADQRVQLPGLGDAREARPGVPRRAADDRQAGRADVLRHRGGGPRDRRVGDPPGGLGPAADGQPGRAARRADRPGPCRLHRLGAHRRAAPHPHQRAARRRHPRCRGRLAQLLDPRTRRDRRRPRSSTCSSRAWSPR